MSEDAAIITSMNLYEFSQQNNDEMGIHVSRSQEPALYKEIKDEALRLRRMADPRQGAPTETSPPTAPDQPPAAIPDQHGRPLGYCIRCQAPSLVLLLSVGPGLQRHPRPLLRSLRVSGIITTNAYRMDCGARYETHTHTHTHIIASSESAAGASWAYRTHVGSSFNNTAVERRVVAPRWSSLCVCADNHRRADSPGAPVKAAAASTSLPHLPKPFPNHPVLLSCQPSLIRCRSDDYESTTR